MNNVKKTLATATFALSSIVATAIIPATSVIGTSVAMTGLMTISLPAQAAQQCANLVFKSQGTQAHGAFYEQRSVVLSAELNVNGGVTSLGTLTLGSRYADLDNARNIVINCRLKDAGLSMSCTVVAQPCTDD